MLFNNCIDENQNKVDLDKCKAWLELWLDSGLYCCSSGLGKGRGEEGGRRPTAKKLQFQWWHHGTRGLLYFKLIDFDCNSQINVSDPLATVKHVRDSKWHFQVSVRISYFPPRPPPHPVLQKTSFFWIFLCDISPNNLFRGFKKYTPARSNPRVSCDDKQKLSMWEQFSYFLYTYLNIIDIYLIFQWRPTTSVSAKQSRDRLLGH